MNKEIPTNGSFFREQAIALKKSGLDVTVMYTDLSYKNRIVDKKEMLFFNDHGVETYINYKFKIPLKNYGKMISFNKGILSLFGTVYRNKQLPDIIHAHSCFWGGYAAMELSKKYNVPYVITTHYSGFALGTIKRYEAYFVRQQLRDASKVIAVSEGLKEHISKYCDNDKIEVIGNVVNTDFFKPNCHQNNYDGKFTFLTISYLRKIKKVDNLLYAFSKCLQVNKNIRLIIGGEGEERENLIQLAKVLKLEENVKFTGSLNREEVLRYMQNCDVFVLPSQYETFGVVLIEALACGKPVIATKTDGPNSIVNERNGYMVEVDNIEKLFEAMLQSTKSFSQFNKNEIREYCINKFSEKSISDSLKLVYNLALKK
jgi:L-malate glycosyltransferase